MTGIAALIDGIAARLETISGLRVADHPPGQVAPPSASIRVEGVNYSTSARGGSYDVSLVVLLLVASVVDRAAYDALYAYLDPDGATSVYAAVEGDPYLGDICDGAQVTSVRNVGQVNVSADNTTSYLGAELVVELLVS
jgi:hypothetical protein